MSSYFHTAAASEIAAAFCALPADISVVDAPAQRTRMSNGPVGKGHPPREVPL